MYDYVYYVSMIDMMGMVLGLGAARGQSRPGLVPNFSFVIDLAHPKIISSPPKYFFPLIPPKYPITTSPINHYTIITSFQIVLEKC